MPFARLTAPLARLPGVGFEALQLRNEDWVARSLTTTEVGTPGVEVLLMISLTTERELSAFGVTTQAQQETISSAGSKA
jgi:hypothetical protein